MKQGRITKLVLAVIFAGLVISPLVIKRISSARDSGSVKLDAKEALAHHGFYLEDDGSAGKASGFVTIAPPR